MVKGEDAELQRSDHEKDTNVLEFMDSTDSYLVLMNSLSSSLRQGWLELASARHSMGASRISSALFDLKSHSAATTLQLNHQDAGPKSEKLHFSLCKWASSESPKSCSEDAKFEEDKLLQRTSNSSKVLNQDGSSNFEVQEEAPETTESPRTVEDQVHLAECCEAMCYKDCRHCSKRAIQVIVYVWDAGLSKASSCPIVF